MCDYSKGKIYSIRSHLTDDVYIGSTIETLSNRLSQHKKYYQKWLITKKRYTTSYKIIEKDAKCYIELVELYPCNSKIELHRREGEIIRATTCVNKNIAGRTQKEWFEENKQKLVEQRKEHYNDNKQQLLEKQKQYRDNNKQKIAEKNKQYYENNKEQISDKTKEYKKQWYDNNKEKINQKYTCECGSTLSLKNKLLHFKTKKHQTFINSSN